MIFIFTFGANANSFAMRPLETNKINAKITEGFEVSSLNNRLEKVKIAEMDIKELKVGDNEIYNDGETIISLKIENPVYTSNKANPSNIQPMAGGDSGWSGGYIPNTATLYPNRSTSLIDLGYTLFWHNRSIDSVHSLNYKIGLGTVTNASTYIIRPTPDVTHASAIGEVHYVVTEFGAVIGSYNVWLRIDINWSGQVRLVWNY